MTLHWGGQMLAAGFSTIGLQVNGTGFEPASVRQDQAVAISGHINMIWVFVSFLVTPGQVLNKLVLKVNGVDVYDSDIDEVSGPSLVQFGVFVATAPWIPVSAGDELSVFVSKSAGTDSTIDVNAYVQVV